VAQSTHRLLRGVRSTAAHREAVMGSVRQALSAQRKTHVIIDHYRCTDWDVSYDGGATWSYYGTTCQYVDSFWVDDGTGVDPYGSPIFVGAGGNTNSSPYGDADNILQGCGTNKDGTAKKAQHLKIIDNPGYEWAGFILKDAQGNYWFSQGQLLPLDDKLQANIGAPSTHVFPDGYSVVGYYHTHPNVSPDQVDLTTGGVFSASDEDYAQQYQLDANVMLIWNDTSLGTSNTKTADYSREYSDPPAPASAAKNISNAGC
jgi:hypothetical protein